MPEIQELLRDAAPEPRPFDEAAIRRRVAQRRARRRGVALAALLLVVGTVAGVVVAADDGREDVFVDTPLVPADATSLTVVDGEVWLGGDGWVMREDGSGRVEVEGQVLRLEAVEGVIWVRGSTWVAAIDPADERLIGSWGHEKIEDIQPFGDQVAVPVVAEDEVVILSIGPSGLEETVRIPTGDQPLDVVLTTDGSLWVREFADRTISRLDVATGRVVTTHAWAGPALAPSRGGGIWSADGTRLVDLYPELLAGGQSVALGERYNVITSGDEPPDSNRPVVDLAVETDAGVFASGSGGLRRYDPSTPDGELVDSVEASAMAVDGENLVYLIDGEVRRFSPAAVADQPSGPDDRPIGVWPETMTDEARAAVARLDAGDDEWRGDQQIVASRFLADVLGWPDPVVTDGEPSEDGRFGESYSVESAALGLSASVTVWPLLNSPYWVVAHFTTFGDEDGGLSVSIGNGEDGVFTGHWIDGTVAELVVRYGDAEFTDEDDEAPAGWDFDLGEPPETTGMVMVLFRRADGIAVGGFATPMPAGSFAAS